jgi:hypothetical protein
MVVGMKLLRILRILALVLVALDFLDPAHGVFVGASAAAQTLPIPYLSGPQDPSQMNATINSVIQRINAVLSPVLASGSTSVNNVAITGGVTGSPLVIGLQTGADANAGITISPNGSGNVKLFSQNGTGVLQFGNQTSFVTAGLANAPGIVSGKAPLGMSDHLRGYILMQDWLGRSYGFPVY